MATWGARLRLLDLDLFDDDLNARLREAACALLKALEQDAKPNSYPDHFTNEDVLGSQATYPKTLHNYALEDPEHWWWDLNAESHGKFRDFFSNIRNFAFLGQTRHGIEYHSKLPPSDVSLDKGAGRTSHDVWLICKPYASKVEAFRHWSVLTQGRIAHLTTDKGGCATGLPSQTMSKRSFVSHLTAEGMGMADVKLKWQDFSSSSYKKYQELQSRPNPTKFVAYNVGRTMYTPWQVSRLAETIIDRMNLKRSYHLFDNNCQHFAISLIRHIVMTQRRDIAIGGTLLEIVDYDQGRPGLELKKWLTRAKRRLLFLSESVSKSKTRSESTDSLGSIDNRTWAYWVHVGVFKKTWLEVPLEIIASEHRIAEARVQYGKHGKERVHSMGRLMKKSSRLMQKSNAFLQMVMWARTWLVRSSWLSATVPWVKYAIPAVGAASSITAVPAAILGAGFFLYLFISRTLYARGSAKPVHYDVKRTGQLLESPSTSSDEDSDQDGLSPDDDGGGGGENTFLLMDYTPELLEDGLQRAEDMFSPNWFARDRSREIPSLRFTTASGEPAIPRGAMTPDYQDRRGLPIPVRSHSSSPALPIHESMVRRAGSPAPTPDRPLTAGSMQHIQGLRSDAPRSHSAGPSSGQVIAQRRASSPVRRWNGQDMYLSQPIDLHLGQPSFQDPMLTPHWRQHQGSVFLRPSQAYRPRPSLQRRVSSPLRGELPSSLQSWDEESAVSPSLGISVPQQFHRRATSQPPLPDIQAIASYEGEDAIPPQSHNEQPSLTPSLSTSAPQKLHRRATSQPPNIESQGMTLYEEEEDAALSQSSQERPSSFSRHLSEPRRGARLERQRSWTLSSPRPRRRPRPRHSASMPLDIVDIDWETDEVPSPAYFTGQDLTRFKNQSELSFLDITTNGQEPSPAPADETILKNDLVNR